MGDLLRRFLRHGFDGIFPRYDSAWLPLAEDLAHEQQALIESDLMVKFPALRGLNFDARLERVLDIDAPFQAALLYRIAHALYRADPGHDALPYIGHFMRVRTGIELYYSTEIGPRLRIMHGVGAVIGPRHKIGSDFTFYQGVTLGQRGNDMPNQTMAIGDRCFIYAGATVLGALRIGNDVKIAANAVLLTDAEAGQTYAGDSGAESRSMIRALLRKTGLHRPPLGAFETFTQLYLDRCARYPFAPATPGGMRIGILVTPWLSTAVPFFSLECARALAASGAHSVLLWDEVNVFRNAEVPAEITLLRTIVDRLRNCLPVIDVATAPPGAPLETECLQGLLYENAVRLGGGEADAEAFLSENASLASGMAGHAARVAALLAREGFDSLLIPGGFWAASGLWALTASQLNMPFSTYDSGIGSLFLGHNGAAAHFPDVAAAFHSILSSLSSVERERLVQEGCVSLRQRMEGKDEFRLQPHPSGRATERFDLVVPLNYRADTAALHRQRAFRSVTDWLTQLLQWVADRPQATVVIRQHPCERIPQYRGTDDWNRVLAPFSATLGKRFRFASADDSVNTYDLLAGCAVVLPWTSRTGVEAAMLGHAVVLGAHCFYENCGFTASAATPGEYFAHIERALANPEKLGERARTDAAVMYFLLERCLPLKTHFTPQPDDFRRWVTQSPGEIWESPAGKLLREALLTRQSIATLQFRDQLRSSLGSDR